MLFYPQEKLALFIDGANLYGAAKGLQFDIDYKRLLELFARKGILVRAFYYTAVAEDQEFSPLRPLVDWLDYNGFSVVTKPLKEFTDAQGRRRVKGNMDIELAIDVMEMAEQVDHIVIFSGDGDFRRLVEAAQRKGRRVSVVSTIRTQPPDGGGRAAPPGRQFHRAGRAQAANCARGRRAQQRLLAAHITPRRHSNYTASASPSCGVRRMNQAAEPPPDCPLCPRLAAFRRRTAPVSRLLQRSGAELRCARCATADRGLGAGTARRQPHGPAFHRRLCRRSALRDLAQARSRQRQLRRTCG